MSISRSVINGCDAVGRRGGAGAETGELNAGLEPGGRLGVPTESTGRLGIFAAGGGSLTSEPTLASSAGESGGFDDVMQA
jgi:hypothetical protein